ncbi:outer membrane protein OmpK [Catenovulum sp. SX2]|uniref:outer membrane protein OmpK n=1 Tax=Catenovulum sp. SX2 TaxID=3398614 RepID=UPI003F824C35
MKNKLLATAIGSALLFSTSAFAEMKWSSYRLSYIQADKYQVGDNSREVLTVEHASGHNWGDNFFFSDHLMFSDGTVSNYFELSPRLSLSYLSGADLSFGPVKDVYLTSTWEGGDTFDNFLYGVSMGLKVPGFKYFNVSLYKANNDKWQDDEQVTLTWALPSTIAGQEFLWDGFLDYSTSSEGREAEMNFTSQLKWNISPLLGISSQLYVGIEYAYWTNKFGKKDVNERNPGLLVKWHF